MRLSYTEAAALLGTSKATISRRASTGAYASGPMPSNRRNARWVEVPDEEIQAAGSRPVDESKQMLANVIGFPLARLGDPSGEEATEDDAALQQLWDVVTRHLIALEDRIAAQLTVQRANTFEDRVLHLMERRQLQPHETAMLNALIKARSQLSRRSEQPAKD